MSQWQVVILQFYSTSYITRHCCHDACTYGSHAASVSDFHVACFTIPPGTCKEAEAYRAGSHYLHKLNDLNAETNPSPAVTWTPSNVQSRHMPRELHTNQDGIFLCILPYLNISDFSLFRRFVSCITIPPQRCTISGVMKFNPILHYTMLLL